MLWLCSPGASFVIGHGLAVGGGVTAERTRTGCGRITTSSAENSLGCERGAGLRFSLTTQEGLVVARRHVQAQLTAAAAKDSSQTRYRGSLRGDIGAHSPQRTLSLNSMASKGSGRTRESPEYVASSV